MPAAATSAPGPTALGPMDPGPGTSVFSQLLALAAKVASLLSQEEHYALRVAKADTTYRRVMEKLVGKAIRVVLRYAIPLARLRIARKSKYKAVHQSVVVPS